MSKIGYYLGFVFILIGCIIEKIIRQKNLPFVVLAILASCTAYRPIKEPKPPILKTYFSKVKN